MKANLDLEEFKISLEELEWLKILNCILREEMNDIWRTIDSMKMGSHVIIDLIINEIISERVKQSMCLYILKNRGNLLVKMMKQISDEMITKICKLEIEFNYKMIKSPPEERSLTKIISQNSEDSQEFSQRTSESISLNPILKLSDHFLLSIIDIIIKEGIYAWLPTNMQLEKERKSILLSVSHSEYEILERNQIFESINDILCGELAHQMIEQIIIDVDFSDKKIPFQV